MGDHLPIILIELLLVGGGVLAFGWWQLRSVQRDREAAARRRAETADAAAPGEATRPPSLPVSGPNAAQKPAAGEDPAP
jgi:hypothetical protein